MKKFRCVLAVLCSIVLMDEAAWAQSAFLVQVGKAPTEKEAEAKWKEIQSKYTALMKGLKLTLRTVTPEAGGASEFRIQAGPTKNRDAARHICAVLRGKGTECYIVETAMFEGEASYPTVTMSADQPDMISALEGKAPAAEAEKADSKPEKEEKKAAKESKAKEDTKETKEAEADEADKNVTKVTTPGWLPWLGGQELEAKPEKKEAEKKEPAKEEKKEAKAPENKPIDTSPIEVKDVKEPAPKGRVQVAEAIPVPLSQDTIAHEAKEEQKEVAAPPVPKVVSYHPAFNVPDAEWLQVSGFVSEQDAYSFYEALSKHMDDNGSMRVRITQHMHLRGQSARAELDIGPVESSKVSDVCNFAVGYDTALRCGRNRMTQDHVVTHDEMIQMAETSGTYIPPVTAQRPEVMGTTPAVSPAAASPSAGKPKAASASYFAQLSSWPKKSEAMNQWEKLKTINRTLLANYKPDIREPGKASLNAKRTYRLRIGPIESEEEAETLCKKLKKRHTGCLVVSE